MNLCFLNTRWRCAAHTHLAAASGITSAPPPPPLPRRNMLTFYVGMNGQTDGWTYVRFGRRSLIVVITTCNVKKIKLFI